jgi:DNA-binding SARP family transcriptional activator
MDAVPTRIFELRLFGRFELNGPDGAIELTAKKVAALLAYLACTAPEPQSRDKLISLLWGSRFEDQARQSLRQALARLRRVLGQRTIISEQQNVGLRLGTVRSDVTRFEALLSDGSQPALEAAVGMYRNGLLLDLDFPEEPWREWLGVQRRRLEEMALNAMVRLGHQEHLLGRHDRAQKLAGQAIALSDLREDAHRLLMQALAAGGRRADALKHYEDVKTQLKRQLNVEPDPSTTALAEELRRPQFDSDRRPTPRAALPSSGRARSEPRNRVNVDWHPPCHMPRWFHYAWESSTPTSSSQKWKVSRERVACATTGRPGATASGGGRGRRR